MDFSVMVGLVCWFFFFFFLLLNKTCKCCKQIMKHETKHVRAGPSLKIAHCNFQLSVHVKRRKQKRAYESRIQKNHRRISLFVHQKFCRGDCMWHYHPARFRGIMRRTKLVLNVYFGTCLAWVQLGDMTMPRFSHVVRSFDFLGMKTFAKKSKY